MFNFRLRLYLLVLATTLPFILYTGYAHVERVNLEQTRELNNLSTIAQLTAAEHLQITEGARQLLISLSITPRVQTPSACSPFLATLLSSYLRYTNFGVVDNQGRILCAADLAGAKQNPPSQTLIDQTLSTNSFKIGSYYPTQPSGAVLNYAYPLSPTTVIYASLSLDWVSQFVDKLNAHPSDLVINVLDQNGTVLARSPKTESAIGQNFAQDPLVQEILAKGEGQTTKLGIDQVSRLYAFSALDPDHSAYIAVGTPTSRLNEQSQRSLYLSILTIFGITALSFFLAYQIGQHLLLKQIESLKQIDHLKDEFVSLASHQLRSPLTGVRWLSEAILETPRLSPKLRGSVAKIHVTTLRLINLTSSLLQISRLESGALAPHPHPGDLVSLLRELVAEHKIQAASRQLTIQTTLPRRLKYSFDPQLLHELIGILLSNAIKYSHPRGKVQLALHVHSDHLQIRVTDHGIGVPANLSPRLFTRFYRADNARDFAPDGTGLGLYLARLISQQIGARLDFKSTKLATVFTLTLPNKV